jgi:cyclic peptide transporter
MVVIVLITSSVDSDVEVKYLLFYYVLSASVYLIGRRYVQINLIRHSRELTYDLRTNLIDKIFSTSYQKFEKMDRGRVYTALNDDVDRIGESANIFVMLVTSLLTAIGAFLYLATIAFWATMLTILLISAISILYYFVSKSTDIYFEKARDTRNVFMRFTNGLIDGFKELSLHRNKKLEYKRDVIHWANEFREKVSTANIRFVNAFLVGESLLVILLGAVTFAIPKFFPDIRSYTVLSFVLVLLYLIGPINGILGAVPAIMQFKIAWKRIHQFLNEIPTSVDMKTIPTLLDRNVERIKTVGIKYKYKNVADPNSFVVGPIDLEIRRGEILFIIGGNGSGKTTLAKLLVGLYEPDEGEVIVNDKVVNSSRLGEFFSVVFSPCYLFEKLYNIDVNGRQHEVKNYLKRLHLDEKVNIEENKYSTIDLSGGQRKRLALLQCYLEDSPIYLFDEWAADQDPEYRNFFYRTLLPEMKRMGKIVIAVTHDDHYFDVADKVLKMNEGKLESYSSTYLVELSQVCPVIS